MALADFFDPKEIWKKQREDRLKQDSTPERVPFSLREGLDTFSKEGANAFKAPADSPFLRSMAPQDRPKAFTNQEKTDLITNRPDRIGTNTAIRQVGGNWDQLNQNQNSNQITARSPEGTILSGMQSNLTPYDEQVKSSMNAINNKLASMPMEDVSPEQLNKIQELRQQAGFMRGGTDRVPVGPDGLPLRNLNTSGGPLAQQAEARFNSRPAVNPTEKQLAQWDFNEGLKSGRTQLPTDPYAGLTNHAKRELMVQDSRNRQSGLENMADNQTAAERNRILEEGNIRDNTRLLAQAQVKARPESKIINRYDPITGNTIRQDIVSQDANGNWVNNQINQSMASGIPNLTPTQRSKAVAYAKANPNMDKAIILQKIASGEI